MRIRPIFSEADTLAGASVKYHPTILAMRHMGYWYIRTISKGPRRIQVPDRCHRYFYQMGRGRAGRTYHQGKHSQILAGIVMHFGVPNQLISDNATQLISKKFENFCATYRIKHPRSSVNHPMTNGNAKRANGIILQGTKNQIFDRLKAYDKKWAGEVPTNRSTRWPVNMSHYQPIAMQTMCTH